MHLMRALLLRPVIAQTQSKRPDACTAGRGQGAGLGSCDPSLLPLFSHFSSIKVVPIGASRGMKKLLQEKFPNMSQLQDISELLAT